MHWSKIAAVHFHIGNLEEHCNVGGDDVQRPAGAGSVKGQGVGLSKVDLVGGCPNYDLGHNRGHVLMAVNGLGISRNHTTRS